VRPCRTSTDTVKGGADGASLTATIGFEMQALGFLEDKRRAKMRRCCG